MYIRPHINGIVVARPFKKGKRIRMRIYQWKRRDRCGGNASRALVVLFFSGPMFLVVSVRAFGPGGDALAYVCDRRIHVAPVGAAKARQATSWVAHDQVDSSNT